MTPNALIDRPDRSARRPGDGSSAAALLRRRPDPDPDPDLTAPDAVRRFVQRYVLPALTPEAPTPT
ncbi:MAG: hypothetical protein Q8K58_16245, partial [Acidimicrobiales bacterium]|nr:hypothetical protein [Acidimicrobiales bacterium]